MYHTDVSNSANIIDSRDVIARIAELEAESGGLDDELDELEQEELTALRELASEGETLADWPHGETLIRDSYFEDYARELADDIGAIDSNASWPLNHIDWKAAAEELQVDYTEIDYDGVTYWARS